MKIKTSNSLNPWLELDRLEPPKYRHTKPANTSLMGLCQIIERPSMLHAQKYQQWSKIDYYVESLKRDNDTMESN